MILRATLGALGLGVALSLAAAVRAESSGEAVAPAGESLVTASVGIRYDRDLSVDLNRIPLSDAVVLETSLYGEDERAVRGVLLRSLASVDVETDLKNRDRDYQTLSLTLGPVFDLPRAFTLYTALKGSAGFFDYDFYSAYGALALAVENMAEGPLRFVELDLGYERFGSAFDDEAAAWASLLFTGGLRSVLRTDDWLEASLYSEHYQSDAERFRYTQTGPIVEYGQLLGSSLQASLIVTGHRQWYAGAEPGVEGRRRDWFLNAEISLLYSGLIFESLSAELRAFYEQNWSNDPDQDYDGQSVVLRLHWGF